MENTKPVIISTGESQPIEIKDSIKLTKNTRGYNYEIRLVAKEGVDLLEQLDFVQAEVEKKIKKWTEQEI
jgi:hypothetical protein